MVFSSGTLSSFKAKYETVANAFIEEINNTTVTIFYSQNLPLANTATALDIGPNVIGEYGGLQSIDSIDDRQQESGSNLKTTTASETIKARVYWANQNSFFDGNVRSVSSRTKIITYIENIDKLRNASYITANGIKLKLFQTPVPYGLFGEKQYCVSYWDQI